mmetsp:Transcript_7350/g.6582  ORF Transcript_7350/g.6582 Transcript_7350/m.6582 type:complete len:110 (-) Transcript_7350:624-953(-)
MVANDGKPYLNHQITTSSKTDDSSMNFTKLANKFAQGNDNKTDIDINGKKEGKKELNIKLVPCIDDNFGERAKRPGQFKKELDKGTYFSKFGGILAQGMELDGDTFAQR